MNKDRLYRALDHLLPHKAALEAQLKSRIGTFFEEPFDVLLYDLTSTYFEGLAEGNPQARRGYSRDYRSDCVQVVIGLVVTRSGLPLGYEVFAGNQSEPMTLEGMMAKMEALYGKASRIWVFDRGIASERNLEVLRRSGGPYLVGTPRTLLRKMEAELLEENWTHVREGIEVKRVASPDGSQDSFILCRSSDRQTKEAAIHDRFERQMEERLGRIETAVKCGRLRSRDVLQQRLGRLKLECSRVAHSYSLRVEGDRSTLSFSWTKDEAKARYMRHTEGAYLLRTNLDGHAESELWTMYMQLNDAEAGLPNAEAGPRDSPRPPPERAAREGARPRLLPRLRHVPHARQARQGERPGNDGMSHPRLTRDDQERRHHPPLVDGRELRLRRVSRPDPQQAEILTRLDLDLPERIGRDAFHARGVIQTRP